MNFAAVLAQINDLPATFRPSGNPYAQFIGSLAASETIYADGADGTMPQALAFTNAIDGWIDVWGLLFGVPRNDGEGNIPYATRITETVLAWVGTLPAIQLWIILFAPGGSVSENASGLGYRIILPQSLSPAQATAFIASLGRIRPVGVPFTVQQSGTGLYLGTEGFLGDGTVLGTYLTGGSAAGPPPLNATTPSAQPLIPDLFLVDPNLANPGLLSLAPQGSWPPGFITYSTSLGLNQFAQTYPFWSNGGALTLRNPTLLPLSPTSLAAGDFWSNDGEVSIVPGYTPVLGAALVFGFVTLQQLNAAGGASLPTTNPGVGTGILWNDGNVVAIA